jgi:hypothetical protein
MKKLKIEKLEAKALDTNKLKYLKAGENAQESKKSKKWWNCTSTCTAYC